MIDEVAPTKDMQRTLLWGGAMILCALLAWVTNILANRMAAWVATNQAQKNKLVHFTKFFQLYEKQLTIGTQYAIIYMNQTQTQKAIIPMWHYSRAANVTCFV
mgnify:CR=1 FL=1